MEKLQNSKVAEGQKWQKWFQKDNLIILILAGVLLVVISFPVKKDNEKQSEELALKNNQTSTAEENHKFMDLYEYAEYLEGKLESVLVNMKGVGKVKVMITLETSEEQVLEKDEPIVRDNTTETGNNGENRVIYKMDSGQETVYSKDGNKETPYVNKTILPKVEGVLILAEGAGQGNNSKSILEIAQVLFGVEAHKVKVLPME